jgi:hypothetical protein
MRRTICGSAVALVALALGACATPGLDGGIVQLSPDSYRLSRVDGVGRYADAEAMKAALLEDATAFGQRQGKTVVPTASHEETLRAGHLMTADLEFRLVAPGAAAAVAATPLAGPAVRPAPAVPVAPVPAATSAVSTPAATATAPATAATDLKANFYNELIMLDDLRKRGILTDAEFQAMKTKLLAGK